MKVSSQIQALLDLPDHELQRSFANQPLVRELVMSIRDRNRTIGERAANEIFRLLCKYSAGVVVTLNYPDATDLINEMARIIDTAINPPVKDVPEAEQQKAPEATKKGAKL